MVRTFFVLLGMPQCHIRGSRSTIAPSGASIRAMAAEVASVMAAIKFEEEDPRFSREQLWVFLYNGENPKLIPRMRSTRFHISPAYGESVRREVPKGVDRSDLWRVREMAFTQRNPLELNG